MCGHFVEKRLTSKEPHKLCERQDYLGNDGILLCFFPKKKNAFPFPPKKYVFFRQIDIEIRLLTSKEPHKLCERQDYLGNDGVIMFYKSSSGP